MDLLIDNRGILLIITILAWAWFLWAFMRNRQPVPAKPGTARPGSTNRMALPRKPADVVPLNRTSTGGLAPSIEAGIAEHQVRSSAPTAKLITQPTGDKVRPTEGVLATRDRSTDLEIGDATDTEAKDELFSGLTTESKSGTQAEAPQVRESTPAMQRSERLQEIGFHHPIESEKALPASAPPPMAEMVTPAKPRTQTAELDDILKRIDQVLADTPPPPTESVLLRALPTLPPRPVEKLDPSDVLKRIDEALAEGHGGRASQMTMPRPDWEDEANKVASGEVPIVRPPSPPPAKPTTPVAVKPEMAEEIPNWAKSDIQDEDLPAKPAPTAPPAPPTTSGDSKTESDGKGGTSGQQRLF